MPQYTPTHPLCSMDDVKAALRMQDTADDFRIGLAVDAASRQIEAEVERRFWQDPAPSTRVYVAETPFLATVDDFEDTAGLVVETLPYGASSTSSIVWDPTDFQLEPLNGLWMGQQWPFEKIRAVAGKAFPVYGGIAFPQPYVQALVRITARWGWSYVPVNVRKAAIAQAIALFKMDDVPFGATAFGEVGIVRIRGMSDNVLELLQPYYRTAVFVA